MLDVPEAFRINPGKQEIFFSPDHPYYKKAAADGKLREVMSRSDEIARQEHVKQNRDIYNNFNESDYTKVRFDESSGGFEIAHKDAQKPKPHEKEAINILIAQGHRIIRPQYINKDYQSNFDFFLNDVVLELKSTSNPARITNEVLSHIYQGRNFVIAFEVDVMESKIEGYVNKIFNNSNIGLLLVIRKNGIITRHHKGQKQP